MASPLGSKERAASLLTLGTAIFGSQNMQEGTGECCPHAWFRIACARPVHDKDGSSS